MPNAKSRRRSVASEPLEPRRLLSATLVADINAHPNDQYPLAGLTSVGTVAYFFDDGGTTGRELWKTDGTPAGTTLVKDIWPGPTGSIGGGFVKAGAWTYFTASDGVHGYELWRTDGTDAGTTLVADINPGHGNSNPSSLTAVGALVYFTADDGAHGREIWRSDGTAGGTYLVRDVYAGASGQQAQTPICALPDGTVLFESTDGGTNAGLWRTDGTTAGTAFVTNPSGFKRVYNLTTSGTRAYFSDGAGYVWATDGTTAGTKTVDVVNSSVSNFTDVGGTFFYIRGNVVKGVRATDTAAWTVTGSPAYTGPSSLANVNGTLCFAALDSSTSTPELMRLPSGGTVALQVKTGFASYPANLTNVNGTLYFSVTDSSSNAVLWTSGGTGATTNPVATVKTGSSYSNPSSFQAIGSRLVFVNDTPSTGAELWGSDGTAGGTGLVRDVYPGTASSYAFPMAVLGNSAILLNANDGNTGFELWRSDGTAAGTWLVKDINPGPGGTNPTHFVVAGQVAYFVAGESTHGNELWVTDGTEGGTRLVKDINPGTGSSSVLGGVVLDGILYFTATDGTHGSELWRSDGTDAGTYMVKDINPGSGNGLSAATLVTMNGAIYFAASDGTHGTELWRSDGSAAGTVMVSDIYAGISSSSPASLANVNGTLYFGVTTSRVELWKSDGTAAGTSMVKALTPGYSSSTPSSFTAFGPLVYFSADDGTHGRELWRTDGTPAGTAMVADLNPGSATASPTGLSVVGDQLLFVIKSAAVALKLWKVPAPGQPPELVSAISGPSVGLFQSSRVIGDRLYFTSADDVFSDDEAHGVEMWTSDGTAGGTYMMEDLYPGPTNGVGAVVVGFRGSLYVQGNDGLTGDELYRFETPIAPAVRGTDLTSDGVAELLVTFDKDVSASLGGGDVTLVDSVHGGPAVAATGVTYDPATNVATFDFPSGLPSGVYRATLSAGGVTDRDGRPMAADVTFDVVYVAPGDRYALPSEGGPVRAQGLAIGSGGSLDLGSGSLLLDYDGASPADGVRQLLASGRDGGAWDGPGITSSAAAAAASGPAGAIGYAAASVLGLTAFAGQPVDGTALLLAYTRAGDANLDGRIDGDDFALADAGRARGAGPWVFGDFDYDGAVTDADLTILTRSTGAPAPAPAETASSSPAVAAPVSATAPVTTSGAGTPADRDVAPAGRKPVAPKQKLAPKKQTPKKPAPKIQTPKAPPPKHRPSPKTAAHPAAVGKAAHAPRVVAAKPAAKHVSRLAPSVFGNVPIRG